jgi:hypothetical protein
MCCSFGMLKDLYYMPLGFLKCQYQISEKNPRDFNTFHALLSPFLSFHTLTSAANDICKGLNCNNFDNKFFNRNYLFKSISR